MHHGANRLKYPPYITTIMEILKAVCDHCGAQMRAYPLLKDGEPTGDREVVCPNNWRDGHPI